MKLCMYSMAILFVVLATGCVDVKEGDLKEGFGSIEGTVKNLDGSAVPDALIYIQTNLSLFTKAINDGSFLLQEVPAGIHTGNRLRISKEGEVGARGGGRGDLYVYIVIRPHPIFKREGDTC